MEGTRICSRGLAAKVSPWEFEIELGACKSTNRIPSFRLHYTATTVFTGRSRDRRRGAYVIVVTNLISRGPEDLQAVPYIHRAGAASCSFVTLTWSGT